MDRNGQTTQNNNIMYIMHPVTVLGFDFKLYDIIMYHIQIISDSKTWHNPTFYSWIIVGLRRAYILMYCCTYNNPISNEWSMRT